MDDYRSIYTKRLSGLSCWSLLRIFCIQCAVPKVLFGVDWRMDPTNEPAITCWSLISIFCIQFATSKGLFDMERRRDPSSEAVITWSVLHWMDPFFDPRLPNGVFVTASCMQNMWSSVDRMITAPLDGSILRSTPNITSGTARCMQILAGHQKLICINRPVQ